MRGISVILYILPAGRVGQSVLVLLAYLLHDGSQGLVLHLLRRARGLHGLGQRLDGAGRDHLGGRCAGDQVRAGIERDGGVRFPAEYTLDRGGRVKAGEDGAAEGFDAGDCGGGGARYDDVDGGRQLFSIL